MANKVSLIFTHCTFPPQKIKLKFPGIQWMFFGRDYLIRKRWEDILGRDLKINYKKELIEISYRMRDEFVKWSVELGCPHWNKWEWWFTYLATRSTAISPLYLYLCYIEVLKQLLEGRSGPLIIISESWELLKVIQNYWKDKCKIFIPYKIEQMVRKFNFYSLEILEFFGIWYVFFLKSFYEWLASRWTKIGHSIKVDQAYDPEHVVIHTCIDDGCIGEDRRFYDRYYPKLAEYLRAKGKKVSTLIWLGNIQKRNRFQAFKWFRENKESFLIPQDYYNLYDCVKAFISIIKSSSLSIKHNAVFNSVNILPLLMREQFLQKRNCGAAYFVNQMAIFKKWKKLGYKLKAYFDFWELKYCEAPALISIKKYYPNCKRIAYQHGALLPLLLFANYKTTTEEFEASPHADIGIANSELTYKLLIKEGFPVEYVIRGPALRYMYLSKYNNIMNSSNNFNNIILVCLPLMPSKALELLEVCFQGFQKRPDNINLVFKEHPFMSLDKLKNKVSFKWPDYFEVAKGKMEDWLQKTKCLVVSESSTMVEGIYKNIYTIVYRKETDIDIIPLDIDKNINGWKYVNTPDELREEVLNLRINNKKFKNRLESFFEFSWEGLNKVFS